jgi:hypothetical protein
MSRPPLEPQNEHIPKYKFEKSLNLDTGKDNISDEEESALAPKTRIKDAVDAGKDFIARGRKKVGQYNDRLFRDV